MYLSSIDETNNSIAAYVDLFTKADEANVSYYSSLENVIGKVEEFYSSLADIGTDIGSKLIDNLVDGLNENDFMTSMKEYITNLVVQTSVYTDSLMAKMSGIGAKIANAVAGGVENYDLSGIAAELKAVYETASNTAATATKIVSDAFTGYATGTSNFSVGTAYINDQNAGVNGAELVTLPNGSKVATATATEGLLNQGVASIMSKLSGMMAPSVDGASLGRTITVITKNNNNFYADGRVLAQVMYENIDKVAT